MAKKRKTTARPKHPTHLQQRIKALQARLRELKVDALLVTNPRDIRYLTGFVGDDSWALISQRSKTVYILSDFRLEEQIGREAPHARAIMRKKGLADELAILTNHGKTERIGLQADYVTLAQRKVLTKKLGAKRIVDLDDGLLNQRAVKTDDEIKLIRKAIRIQQKAYQETLEFIEPGQTEEQITAFLEYRMRTLGADGPSFGTIVAADANAALPHAIPGKTKVKAGGIVLIDWGARYGGYCGDLTRVIALGKMKPTMREVYQIVLDAQMAAIDAIKPGKSLQEIDAVARKVIEDAGYGQRFGHSLGHGIGLDIHEQPTLSPRSKGVLEPGHVVTVEPGIYLPGVGGVRIEDDVLVTEKGKSVLSSLPKSLESAII